jgi:hypothetical protein
VNNNKPGPIPHPAGCTGLFPRSPLAGPPEVDSGRGYNEITYAEVSELYGCRVARAAVAYNLHQCDEQGQPYWHLNTLTDILKKMAFESDYS